MDIAYKRLAARVEAQGEFPGLGVRADAAIGCPEVTKEDRDCVSGLSKDFVGNAFFRRSPAEVAQAVQPRCNWIANAMRKPSGGREVHLVPTAFHAETRLDRITENLDGKLRREVRKVTVLGRVLDRMPRECATVADQMAEQRQFRSAHRLLFGTR